MHRTLYMTIFALVMTIFVSLAHYYLWRRLVRDTGLRGPLKIVLTGLTVVLGLSLPAGMILGHVISSGIARSLRLVPFFWLGAMALLLVVTALFDLVRASATVVRKVSGNPIAPERRIFISRLVAGGAVLTAGSLAGAAAIQGKAAPKLRQRTIKLTHLPKAVNGFKIIQLTDLHIGSTLHMRWLEKVVEQTNARRPDLVVITGDLVDGDVDGLSIELSSLRSLVAPHGVFFVTGNHEYYSGADEWIPVIESLGITVLRNEHSIIGDERGAFALLGVDDYNAARMLKGHGPDIEKALKNVPEGMETVLLAHQPREIFRAAEKNIGLMLSGHTHGGQIWPITHLVGLQQPYNRGLFAHPGGRTQIYVSQGTGFWGPPMRLGTENELTEIILEQA